MLALPAALAVKVTVAISLGSPYVSVELPKAPSSLIWPATVGVDAVGLLPFSNGDA